MIDTLNINPCSWAANSWNVLKSCGAWASVIISCSEHGDRYLLDAFKGYQVCLEITLKPVVVEFLEPIDDAIHRPVFFRLDGLTLSASLIGVDVTQRLGEVVTDGLEVSFPVWTVDRIHS